MLSDADYGGAAPCSRSRGKKRAGSTVTADSSGPENSTARSARQAPSVRAKRSTSAPMAQAITKRKAVEVEEEEEQMEKKFRKCEKAGCPATYPVCFASASERCAKNGYTSRWYHLSCGEHFCNECFDHYYRRKGSPS